jgi:DNA polymerase-3 subunit delta'
MCLPPAEAANAFLKTLEEPPDHSLLILTSDRPEQLLPTVRSRCLTFPILPDKHPAPIEGIDELTRLWAESSEPTPLAAYRRASILQSFLLSTRDRLNAQSEQEVEEDEEGDENESAQSASLAGQLVRVREDIITHLIRSAWGRAQSSLRPEIVREVDSLERLRLALARNIDPTLAIEVSCLRIAGLT